VLILRYKVTAVKTHLPDRIVSECKILGYELSILTLTLGYDAF